MPNTYLIRRRIRGVEGMSRMVRAMEMVAIAKMRHAQRADLNGRPYAAKILQVIADLVGESGVVDPKQPLLRRRAINRITIVHITPNKGFSGGLPGAINRLTANFIVKQKVPVSLIAVGRKGIDYMVKYNRNIQAEFSRLGDEPSLNDTLPISHIIIDDYENTRVDAVYLAYTNFINTEKQSPVLQQLLPIEPSLFQCKADTEFIFEPDTATVLDRLLHRYIETEVYHAVLESIASEQSARAVAMQSATENAQQLAQKLTLDYHKERQQQITEELLDICSASGALI